MASSLVDLSLSASGLPAAQQRGPSFRLQGAPPTRGQDGELSREEEREIAAVKRALAAAYVVRPAPLAASCGGREGGRPSAWQHNPFDIGHSLQ